MRDRTFTVPAEVPDDAELRTVAAGGGQLAGFTITLSRMVDPEGWDWFWDGVPDWFWEGDPPDEQTAADVPRPVDQTTLAILQLSTVVPRGDLVLRDDLSGTDRLAAVAAARSVLLADWQPGRRRPPEPDDDGTAFYALLGRPTPSGRDSTPSRGGSR